MVFTAQQAADILTNNLKVSADGPVSTHNDVQTSSPSVGDLLSWNGTNWTNITFTGGLTAQQESDITSANLKVSADGPVSSHSDVETTSPTIGDLLSWNGTNWVNVTAITGISNQQTIDILSNNLKVSADGPVSSHSDVETTFPTIGDLLSWNGTNWVNITAITGISNQQTTDILSNNLKVSADGPVSLHNDVQTSSPVFGDVLSWNGVNWVNRQPLWPNTNLQFSILATPLSRCGPPIPNSTPQHGSHGLGTNTTDSNRLSAYEWNGLPLYNPCGANLEQMFDALVKGNYIVGLEKEYRSFPPYANPTMPTYSEQINWTIRCINHTRKLVGNNTPVKLSQRLANEALWRLEKAWCSVYAPNDIYLGNQYFLPSLSDQALYPSTPIEWPNGSLLKNESNASWRYEIATGQFDNSIQPWWTHYSSILWALLWHQQQSGGIWAQLFGREYIGVALATSSPGGVAYSFTFSGTLQPLC